MLFVKTKLLLSNEATTIRINDNLEELIKGPKSKDIKRYLNKWTHLLTRISRTNYLSINNI